MCNNMKRNILVFFMLASFALLVGQGVLAAYVPMESIPGTPDANITTFPGYVNAVYKFALWSVGISALLMISIGGFMYFTAAGNTSKMESGKKIIADALYGLVAVLFAWVLLNTINPNLTDISLDSVRNLDQTTTTP